MNFLSYLINGISLGSVYAIIALGYTMVYGIAKMLNFAHGDVIMVGCYIVFMTMSGQGWGAVPAVVLSIIVCTILGIVIEKIAYKPLRKAAPLAVLITAIGVSYFLQNTALLIFGEKPVNFTSVVNVPSIKLFDGQIVICGETSVAIIVSILIVVGLSLFINKTKSGRAMLAVSEDRGAAQLMGVNINALSLLHSLLAQVLPQLQAHCFAQLILRFRTPQAQCLVSKRSLRRYLAVLAQYRAL